MHPVISTRSIIFGVGLFGLRATLAKALPPGAEGRSVRIQLDGEAIQKIPGDERADVAVQQDNSPAAQALINAAPLGRAVPVIFIVIGVLSIPVIWDTVQEMLRRRYYGGVLIDTRQNPATIMHDRTLPADLVLLIGPDGRSQRIESRNFTDDMLRALTMGK